MKVTIDIEGAADETLAIVGMPDVEMAHGEALDAMKALSAEAISTLERETRRNWWLPGGVKGFGDVKKVLCSGYGGGTTESEKKGN